MLKKQPNPKNLKKELKNLKNKNKKNNLDSELKIQLLET